MEGTNTELTVPAARLFAGELILCLSEIRRTAMEPTIYLDRIAIAVARILASWEPYATRVLGLPSAVREEGTGFSRVGIVQDVDAALQPLILLRVALDSNASTDELPNPRRVRSVLASGVLLLRNLRNKDGIRQAVDELERLRNAA